MNATLWYREQSDKSFQFNHLSLGHTEEPKPVGNTPDQIKNWKNGKWIFKHVVLTDTLPARVIWES